MSLSTRLSTFFLAALVVVLLGFSVTLYLTASGYVHRQADARLGSALNTLSVAAEITDDGLEWEPEDRRLSFGFGSDEGPLFWTVRDERGRRIDGSPPGPGAAPLDPVPAAPLDGPVDVLDRDGRPWRVIFRRLEAPPARGGTPRRLETAAGKHGALVLAAGVSIARDREALRNLAVTLVALSCGTWFIALVVGCRLTRRGLRPVALMAEAARSIGGDEQGGRLPVPRTGDELEELGRAFNGLLDRLYESHERQRRFTGDASHQLQTPLTAIQGQVDLALRQARSVEEYQRVLTSVQGRTRHLRKIVEALLFLARGDAEAQRPALETLDLGGWLADHLRSRPGGPRSGDLALTVEPDGPHRVLVQPSLLGELVDNLLDNAGKYGDPGTPITVGVGRVSGTIRLSVADRGAGIAAADVPALFEPFFRSEEARRRGTAGLGLGLSVALRLARLFGGSIDVESVPGRGSTFTLRLPEWR